MTTAKRLGWDETDSVTKRDILDPYDYEDDDLEGELFVITVTSDTVDDHLSYIINGQMADPKTIPADHLLAALAVRGNPHHDSKGKFATGGGHMARGSDKMDQVAGLTRDGNAKNDFYRENDFSDPRDHALAAIGRMQGFDGKPQKGSVDDAVAAGGREIHRGILPFGGNSKHEAQSAEQLRDGIQHGEYEPGTGIYGNGYYFSTSPGVAKMYSERPVSASGYSAKKISGGLVARAALHKDAKVVQYDDLQTDMSTWREQAKPKTQSYTEAFATDFQTPPGQYSPHLVDYVAGDPGRFAAMRGYDAIEVPLSARTTDKKNAARIKKTIGSTDLGSEIVVLNRTALVMEET